MEKPNNQYLLAYLLLSHCNRLLLIADNYPDSKCCYSFVIHTHTTTHHYPVGKLTTMVFSDIQAHTDMPYASRCTYRVCLDSEGGFETQLPQVLFLPGTE